MMSNVLLLLVPPIVLMFIVLYFISLLIFIIFEVISFPIIAPISLLFGYKYLPIVAMSFDEYEYGNMKYRKHFEKRNKKCTV
jgi:hypothetical protein